MPKKSSTKNRTQVASLPKKQTKLSAGDMRKVQGGVFSAVGPAKGKVDNDAHGCPACPHPAGRLS